MKGDMKAEAINKSQLRRSSFSTLSFIKDECIPPFISSMRKWFAARDQRLCQSEAVPQKPHSHGCQLCLRLRWPAQFLFLFRRGIWHASPRLCKFVQKLGWCKLGHED
eukprot:1152060-Pelagomonas_calceolata.AAC.6